MKKLNEAVLLLLILRLFEKMTPLLCQEAKEIVVTEITGFINYPVTIRCSVHDLDLSLWLFQPITCGHPSGLTLGRFNIKNETYELQIGNKTNVKTYNLFVNKPTKEIEGNYICQEGGINQVVARLNINTGDTVERNMTVVVNSTAELYCLVEDQTLAHWLFTPLGAKQPAALSSGRLAFNIKDYFLKIRQKDGFVTYNLIIYNTTKDMQGVYSCREQGVSKAEVTLSVEDSPDVWIEHDGTKLSGTINVTVGRNYNLTCIASGVTPQGMISWEASGINISPYVTYQRSANEVSSMLRFKPTTDETTLTCISSGQIAVDSLRVTLKVNALYPPHCNLSTMDNIPDDLRINCYCVGNPEISKVYILVNYSVHTANEVYISPKYPAYINCFAENDLGQLSNKPAYQYEPLPIPVTVRESTVKESSVKESTFPIGWVAAILSIFLLLLCSLLCVIICRKTRYARMSYFPWEPTVSQVTNTMSERPPCVPPPTEERFVATASKYYETVPATETEKESDAISNDEIVAYNSQYFDIPTNDSEDKVYAEANNEDDGTVRADAIAKLRISIGSDLSDTEYFGPLSEVGTLDKKGCMSDVKYTLKR